MQINYIYLRYVFFLLLFLFVWYFSRTTKQKVDKVTGTDSLEGEGGDSGGGCCQGKKPK